jgi:hypothetical protein
METLEQLALANKVQPPRPDYRKIVAIAPRSFVPTPSSELDMPARKPLPMPSKNPGAGVALQEAPEHFFDQGGWKDLVSGCGSREAALRRISHPDPAALVLVRQQVATQPAADSVEARAAERIYRLGQRIVGDLVARLISGEYVATGFQPPSIERRAIPPELWSGLVPNFQDGTGKGDGYSFAHVRIIKAVDLARRESDISERIAVWLNERRTRNGEELRKTLLRDAQHAFEGECTSRAFGAAYRRVYARKPGRPSKR